MFSTVGSSVEGGGTSGTEPSLKTKFGRFRHRYMGGINSKSSGGVKVHISYDRYNVMQQYIDVISGGRMPIYTVNLTWPIGYYPGKRPVTLVQGNLTRALLESPCSWRHYPETQLLKSVY